MSDRLVYCPLRGLSTLRRLIAAADLDGEQDGPCSYAATGWTVRGRCRKLLGARPPS